MACTLSESLSELYSFVRINFSRVSASLQWGTEKLETSFFFFFFTLVPAHLQKRSTSKWLMTPVQDYLAKEIWSSPPNHVPFESSKYLSPLVRIAVVLIHDKCMHDMYTLVHFADKNDMGGKPSQIQCFSESQDQINRYMYRLATLIHVINAIPLT